MKPEYEETFALQRLYEKWVVRDEWLINEEAVPLLSGFDPETEFLISDCKQMQLKIDTAISNGELKIAGNDTANESSHKIKPATIYQWARANSLPLPVELVNLMEFVLKTLMSSEMDSVPQADLDPLPGGNDVQQILGACFAITATFPEQCRNSRGVIKTERILRLLDENRDKLFNGQLPAISSTAIRDIVNHWLMKLK